MASIGNLLIVGGVFALVSTYITIVLWALRLSERDDQEAATKSAIAAIRSERQDFGHTGAAAGAH